MARKRQAGRKTLLRAFYRQILRHGFALGVAAGPGPGTYADGLALADGPLGKAAVELAANEFAERNLEDTPQMAMGGLVTQPTYALIGEAGPEMVIPLSQMDLPLPSPKKKRKVSKYQKEFGRQMKLLKAKHPRTPVRSLMAKGHTATRKALNMPRKRRRA
jgi:SLT domain-containing protein